MQIHDTKMILTTLILDDCKAIVEVKPDIAYFSSGLFKARQNKTTGTVK